MLNVFLTVDTEVWPFSTDWPVKRTDFSEEINNYLYGVTSVGSFGVPYQVARLNKYGLKATYFVEALFASVCGRAPLSNLVSLIKSNGQDAQLHIHTEWLGNIRDPGLPRQPRRNIQQYSEVEQTAIIAAALSNLRACGATNLVAFRAGNFGANPDTLRALRNNGILFDSSHNTCYLSTTCDMSSLGWLVQPRMIEGVTEIPISFFSDYPNHFRHAQLGACSFAELREALLWAWRASWRSFVIVLHSYELVRNHFRPGGNIAPNRMVISRFEKLCQFLDRHRDKFRTTLFSEIEPAMLLGQEDSVDYFRSSLHRTAYRYGEQLLGKFL